MSKTKAKKNVSAGRRARSRGGKDVGVELMRVLGCLIVIACHCVVQYRFDDTYYWPNTFIACLWSDGVGIFWLIAGFFAFRNAAYGKKFKNFTCKRLLPTLAVGMTFFYLYDWMTSDVSLTESLAHTGEAYGSLITGLLKLDSPFPKTGHFWYVYVYVLVLAVLPALKGFYDWMKETPGRKKGFMAVSFGVLLINDVMKNETFAFSNLSINALVPACLFLLWGAVLYDNREKVIGPVPGLLSIPALIAVNMLRAWIVTVRNDDSSMYWFTTFGLLCATLFFILCANLGQLMKDRRIGRVFVCLGSFTFMIYLIHYGIKDTISYLGVKDYIKTLSPPGAPLYVFLYNILMQLAVFAASLLAAIVLRYVKEGLFWAYRRIRKR